MSFQSSSVDSFPKTYYTRIKHVHEIGVSVKDIKML